MSPKSRQVTGERRAVALLLGFLLVWLLTQITVNFVQAAQNGYGSGLGDGNHLPTQQILNGVRDSFLLKGAR